MSVDLQSCRFGWLVVGSFQTKPVDILTNIHGTAGWYHPRLSTACLALACVVPSVFQSGTAAALPRFIARHYVLCHHSPAFLLKSIYFAIERIIWPLFQPCDIGLLSHSTLLAFPTLWHQPAKSPHTAGFCLSHKHCLFWFSVSAGGSHNATTESTCAQFCWSIWFWAKWSITKSAKRHLHIGKGREQPVLQTVCKSAIQRVQSRWNSLADCELVHGL